jgi:hypothetical protein
MQTQCDARGVFPATFVKDLKPWLESQAHLKPSTKPLMQFAAFMRDEAQERGPDALATVLPFNQKAILEENKVYLMATLEFVQVSLLDMEDPADAALATSADDAKKSAASVPGKPSFRVFTGTA